MNRQIDGWMDEFKITLIYSILTFVQPSFFRCTTNLREEQIKLSRPIHSAQTNGNEHVCWVLLAQCVTPVSVCCRWLGVFHQLVCCRLSVRCELALMAHHSRDLLGVSPIESNKTVRLRHLW